MPYETYKLIHFLGIFLIFTTLGARALAGLNGLDRASDRGRALAGALHGAGLFLVLLGGFGMLARMGLTAGLPGWVHAKLTIWLLLGAALALPYRFPKASRPLLVILPLLGGVAAWVAVNKPF